MATTLTQFQTRVRLRADMQADNFVQDAVDLIQWINDSISELYDLLLSVSQRRYITSAPFTVAGAGVSFALPAGFISFEGLDVTTSGQVTSVPRGDWGQRNEYIDLRYVLAGATVYLFPASRAPGTYTAWYVPVFTPLVNPGDSFDGVNGWEEYVVVDCAIKCRVKEQSDTSELQLAKSALLKRIQSAAKGRDRSEPPKIADVSGELGGLGGWYP